MNEDQLTRALTENFLRDRLQPMPSLSPEQQEALTRLVQGSMSNKLGLEQPSQSAGRNVRLIRDLYKNFDKMDQVSDESEQEFIRNNPRYRSVSRNLPFNQR